MKRGFFAFFVLLALTGISSLSGTEFHTATAEDTLKIIEGDTIYTYMLAASRGDSSLVLGLLKHGIKVDTTAWEGVTALMYAVKNDHPGTVKVLAENGARLNKKDTDGNSPLLAAVQSGNLMMSEYLIRKGADINQADNFSITPLMFAVGIDSFALADMLLYYGADVSKTDRNGTTALMVAAVTGNLDVVYALLEAGADVNCRDKKGFTPLHAATWYGYWSVVELLLDYGADPNLETENGYTSLDVAIEADDRYATTLLASAGADMNQRISFSQNPLTLAVEKKNDSIVSFLRGNRSRFNYWPCFNKYGFGTEMNWNANDYGWNFFVAASEKKYNLNVSGGWGFRPSAIRVLESESESVDYQYWERRGNLFLSLDKSVFFIHGRNGLQAGLYGGLKGIYTYGSYRGAGEKPNDDLIAVPGLGITLEGKSIRLAAGYEYLNLNLYKINPHRVSVSVSILWNRKKNYFKPNFINWF